MTATGATGAHDEANISGWRQPEGNSSSIKADGAHIASCFSPWRIRSKSTTQTAIIGTGSLPTGDYYTSSATILLMEQDQYPTGTYPRQDVLMTRAISLRSRVRRKPQARFWRPAERGDPSAEFNGQKPAHFQVSLCTRPTKRSPTGPADGAVQEQRAASAAGDGPPQRPPGILVLGNRRGPEVVHTPRRCHPLYLWAQARGGRGHDAGVFDVSGACNAGRLFAHGPTRGHARVGRGGGKNGPDLGAGWGRPWRGARGHRRR